MRMRMQRCKCRGIKGVSRASSEADGADRGAQPIKHINAANHMVRCPLLHTPPLYEWAQSSDP